MADKNENPVNRLLENPVFYGLGAVLGVVASVMGWMDATFLFLILPAAAFGTYRWYQKRNA